MVKGIEEMTCEAGSLVRSEPSATVTATALSSSTCTATAAVPSRTSPPLSTTRSTQRSHIMPGPYFGYWNSSMRLVTSAVLSRRRPSEERKGSHTAFHSDIPLIRWAPQSAESSDAGTPQTFSL